MVVRNQSKEKNYHHPIDGIESIQEFINQMGIVLVGHCILYLYYEEARYIWLNIA